MCDNRKEKKIYIYIPRSKSMGQPERHFGENRKERWGPHLDSNKECAIKEKKIYIYIPRSKSMRQRERHFGENRKERWEPHLDSNKECDNRKEKKEDLHIYSSF